MIANAVLIILLLLPSFLGLRAFIKRLNGESCCSSGNSELKINPLDKNKSHYPYKTLVKIEGMKCKNCASYIQNKLNESGFYAKVNLRKKSAKILSKESLSGNEKIEKIITSLGYSVV